MVNPLTLKIRAKKLGVLLKDARMVAGKSLKDCAAVLGVTSRTMGAYEQGEKSPSLPELEVLAYFLDVPMAHFGGQSSRSTGVADKIAVSNLIRLVPLRGKIVGALLKKARTEAEVARQDLAGAIGITTRRLTSYENGDNLIPLPELEGLANFLGIPMEIFRDRSGVVGKWAAQQESIQQFLDLPEDLQDFVTKPVNRPFLGIAQRLSGMSVEELRAIAEGLLDITL